LIAVVSCLTLRQTRGVSPVWSRLRHHLAAADTALTTQTSDAPTGTHRCHACSLFTRRGRFRRLRSAESRLASICRRNVFLPRCRVQHHNWPKRTHRPELQDVSSAWNRN